MRISFLHEKLGEIELDVRTVLRSAKGASIKTKIKSSCDVYFESVSHPWSAWGHTHATMYVWQFFHKESLSKYVSLDCLDGMWSLLLCVRAITTCSRKVKDRLIWLASFCKLPTDPVFSTRSPPAKSIKCNLLLTTSGSRSVPSEAAVILVRVM